MSSVKKNKILYDKIKTDSLNYVVLWLKNKLVLLWKEWMKQFFAKS